MKAFFRILLWSIAIQGMLYVSMSPQADFIPNHLYAFAAAPAIAVYIATVRHFSTGRILFLMMLAYAIAFFSRILWGISPWWNYDLGLPFGILAVPCVLLCTRLLPRYGT